MLNKPHRNGQQSRFVVVVKTIFLFFVFLCKDELTQELVNAHFLLLTARYLSTFSLNAPNVSHSRSTHAISFATSFMQATTAHPFIEASTQLHQVMRQSRKSRASSTALERVRSPHASARVKCTSLKLTALRPAATVSTSLPVPGSHFAVHSVVLSSPFLDSLVWRVPSAEAT